MSPLLSRPPGPEDRLFDLVPEVVHEPASVEEASEALRLCGTRGASVVFRGGGTSLEVGGRPSRLGSFVSTARLARIVEHAPADQIVTVEAGIPLAALQEALRPHGQRVSLDPPLPERATVGGLVAANGFGPLRTRYGTMRDLIVGATLVRADGVVAKGGGKVVKNVAGFDLPRLICSSLGTLALLARATLRLHPLPESSETLLLAGPDAAGLRALHGKLKDAQLEPAAVAALGTGPFEAAVRFEGFRAAVTAQRERLKALVAAWEGGPRSCDLLDEAASAALWERHDSLRTVAPVRLKVAARPSQVEAVVRELLPPLLGALAGPSFVWYPTLGLGFISGTCENVDAAAGALATARQAAERLGGSLVLHAAPPDLASRVDPWGAVPASVRISRSLKDRLDPHRILAPGRLVGGL